MLFTLERNRKKENVGKREEKRTEDVRHLESRREKCFEKRISDS